MVKRVDVVVYDVVRQVVDGQFVGGLRSFGLKEEGISYVSEGPHAKHIPPEVRTRVDKIRTEIVEGRIEVLPDSKTGN